MTGLLIFTGWLVSITNQYDTYNCVAHAVSACGSIYGYQGTPEYYVKKLRIGPNGYVVNNLVKSLNSMKVSKSTYYNWESATDKISSGPLLLNFGSAPVEAYSGVYLSYHTACAVGYDKNYIYIANSYGTGRGYEGYGRISSGDVGNLMRQSMGDKKITPTLINLKLSND